MPHARPVRRLTSPSWRRSSMAERKSGLAALPAGLLRPTTQPEPEPESAEPPVVDEAEGQGGGTAAESRSPKPRKRRAAITSGPSKGRKLHLPDDIHDRLWLLARQRRT